MAQKITKNGYNNFEHVVLGCPELVWHLLDFELFMLNLFLNVDNPVVRKKKQVILFSSILLSKIQQPIPRVGGRMVLFYMQGFLLLSSRISCCAQDCTRFRILKWKCLLFFVMERFESSIKQFIFPNGLSQEPEFKATYQLLSELLLFG